MGRDTLSRGEIFGALCGLLLSVVAYLAVDRLSGIKDFEDDARTRLEEVEKAIHLLEGRLADTREAGADRERRLREVERSCKTP